MIELRPLVPRVLAAVTRRHRDFAAAEDAVQEALLAASAQWPTEGVPDDPCAWLVRVASRRVIDQVRADAARQRRHEAVLFQVPVDELVAPPPDAPVEQDDALTLLLMCCHPSLERSPAIALTLRAVGGLTTAEIAAAYLVPEATMAQRITRAKRRLRTSGVPFSMPADDLDERLEAVLHALYLVFNEGYASTSGPALVRTDLAAEAIRLARQVHEALPAHREAAGLLALLLLTHARRDARTGLDGELVPLDQQDRSRWDASMIAEGTALIDATFAGGPGPYQLQAAIAALHDGAPSVEETDWAQILALYEVLERMGDNPLVTLNRAVALAMVDGPRAGLDLLREVALDHHRLDAVRGHLYERAGEIEAAIVHYRRAASRTNSLPEQEYLLQQAAKLIR